MKTSDTKIIKFNLLIIYFNTIIVDSFSFLCIINIINVTCA